MPRAVVLAGSGAIGWAVALRLTDAGWDVVVTGRRAQHATRFAAIGARYEASDRRDPTEVAHQLSSGADLMVDCACFTAADAALLLPHLGGVTSTVVVSSKAVYVDDEGRHANSAEPPQFTSSITEAQPTLRPGSMDYRSAAGYGPNKVAAEETLLDSGHPVTVLRPSKVHGPWSTQPREWVFVKRVLDGRRVVILDHGGAGADQPSAASNIAALVETVAHAPAARILNAADPDCPSGVEIARCVAAHLGHTWTEVVFDGVREDGVGAHPWDRVPPIALDTTAALALSYQPEGGYVDTVRATLDWLVSIGTRGIASSTAHFDEDEFARYFPYGAEDDYLDEVRAAPATATDANPRNASRL